MVVIAATTYFLYAVMVVVFSYLIGHAYLNHRQHQFKYRVAEILEE